MKPLDMLNPFAVRRAADLRTEQLTEIYGDTVEFQDAATFGKTMQEASALTARLAFGEADTTSNYDEFRRSRSFITLDLAKDNQAAAVHIANAVSDPKNAERHFAASARDVNEHSDETLTNGISMLVSVAGIAQIILSASKTGDRLPSINQLTKMAGDISIPQTELNGVVAINTTLRRQLKRNPDMLINRYVNAVYELDFQMTKLELNYKLCFLGQTSLPNSPAGRALQYASEYLARNNSSLYPNLDPNAGNAQQRFMETRAGLTILSESYDSLLNETGFATSRKRDAVLLRDALTIDRELTDDLLSTSSSEYADVYNSLTGTSSFDELVETARITLLERMFQSKQQPEPQPEPEQILIKPELSKASVVRLAQPAMQLVEIKGLQNLAGNLHTEQLDGRESWTISNKKLKAAGLSELYRELQNQSGDWPGVIDTEAKSYVTTIIRLYEIANDGGLERLHDIFEKENFIQQQMLVVQKGLSEISLEGYPSSKLAELPLILNDVAALRQKWDIIWPFILEHWPNDQGAEVIDQLEILLGIAQPDETKPVPFTENQQEDIIDLTDGDEIAIEQMEVDDEPTIDPRLIEIANQLDWEAFPPDADIGAIRAGFEKTYGKSQSDRVEWKRIEDLLEIKAAYGGTLFRSKPRALGSSKNRIPYFILETRVDGIKMAVAENPVWGNATYVLREELAEYDATWQEVFQESRKLARLLGAKDVKHVGDHHLTSVLSEIQNQMSVRVKQHA